MAILDRRALRTRIRRALGVSLLVILWSGAAAASCSDCTCTGDRDGDGTVTIDEVIVAVNNVLNGCPEFRWYAGCRARIPGDRPCPASLICTTQEVGAPCGEPGAHCCQPESRCLGGECNAPLVCTDRDPRNFPCPISRRRYKHDIEYLAQRDLEQLHGKLLATNLTRFRYNGEPASVPPHLGFIIEDVEPSPNVDSEHDAVDLYGYVSMAVATIQVQDGELKALRREIDTLRRRLGRLEERSTAHGH